MKKVHVNATDINELVWMEVKNLVDLNGDCWALAEVVTLQIAILVC